MFLPGLEQSESEASASESRPALRTVGLDARRTTPVGGRIAALTSYNRPHLRAHVGEDGVGALTYLDLSAHEQREELWIVFKLTNVSDLNAEDVQARLVLVRPREGIGESDDRPFSSWWLKFGPPWNRHQRSAQIHAVLRSRLSRLRSFGTARDLSCRRASALSELGRRQGGHRDGCEMSLAGGLHVRLGCRCLRPQHTRGVLESQPEM